MSSPQSAFVAPRSTSNDFQFVPNTTARRKIRSHSVIFLQFLIEHFKCLTLILATFGEFRLCCSDRVKRGHENSSIFKRSNNRSNIFSISSPRLRLVAFLKSTELPKSNEFKTRNIIIIKYKPIRRKEWDSECLQSKICTEQENVIVIHNVF